MERRKKTSRPKGSPLPTIQLPDTRVDIWCAPLLPEWDHDFFQVYQKILTPEENQRCERFIFEKDRRQFLLTRGLVRDVLSRYAEVEPSDLVFCRNDYGKPSVAHPDGFPVAFSLSHTKGLSVCAVASQEIVGVDVESLQRTTAHSDIAKRFFTAAEVDFLNRFAGDQKRIEFLRLWTLKEAFVKAKGLGLVIPLNSFEIQLASERPASVSFPNTSSGKPEDWHFLQIHLGNSYILGVALHMKRPKPIGVQCSTIKPLTEEGTPIGLEPNLKNEWNLLEF